MAASPDGVLIRDSKYDDSPVLEFDRAAWTAFVDGIRAGDFSRD